MKKILIVEDDNDINQMLCELLSQNGYEVISAFSGTEALMHTKKETFDLVLLDLMLPGKSLQLSKKEYEILKILVENPKKVFTKNNLYESVWQDEFMGDDNTINVHISKIRAKISKVVPDQEYIQTVWGIGFKMQE